MSLHAAPLSQLPTNFCTHQVLRHFRRGHRGDVLSQRAKAQGSIENTQKYHEIIGDHMRSCEIMWDHLTSTLRSSDSKLDDRMRGLHCAKHGGQATPVIPALRTSSISLDKRCTYPWNSYDCQYGSHNDNINNWANMSQHEPTSADFSQKPWFLSSVLLK